MRWYEYQMEVDNLHASEELKAKLLAMQAGGPKATSAPGPARSANRKPPVRFPVRRVLGLAACLAVVAVCFGTLASRGGMLFGGAQSASSTALMSMARGAAPEAAAYALDLDNGLDSAAGGVLENGSGLQKNAEPDAAKIIYRASLTLESTDYDAARTALEAALAEAGGYLESSDEHTGSGDDAARSLSLTLRIPQQQYESFLSAVGEAGNLLNRSQQAEDVTTQYMDIEARLANLTAQRTRLQELQAQAETLSDLLEIESSLSNVQYQIESWQSQLDWYANQVSYSTVSVYLHEVQEYTLTGEGFLDRLGASFGNGWTAFVAGVQGFVLWLAFVWPAALLVLLAAVVVFLVWRRRRRG